MRSVQRRGKRLSAALPGDASVNTPFQLLEECFLCGRCRGYITTITVTLRVVGSDEKGSLKYETVKYGRENQGARTKERLRWQGPAAYIKVRPVLSLERAPHKKKKP
jgi:hypothetical protein